MNRQFYKLYENELYHIQEMAREFARSHPQVAARLDLDSGHFPCADPYVERLLEGFAFLAARVQLKFEEEFPVFVENLLETILPHYLAPVPSMSVVELRPREGDANLMSGQLVPRHARILSRPVGPTSRACEFRTAHDVHCFCLKVESAQYYYRDLGLLKLSDDGRSSVKAALQVTLKLTAPGTISQIQAEKLCFFLGERGAVGGRLYEQLMANLEGVVVRGDGNVQCARLEKEAVKPRGFSELESLLPYEDRSFQGYRLLQEYFAIPQRFLFFDLEQLRPPLSGIKSNRVELLFLFNQAQPVLEGKVREGDVALFCTPIVNLVERNADRVFITDRLNEYPVYVDRLHPLDHEVYRVLAVTGYGQRPDDTVEFRPFYSVSDADGDEDSARAFYAVRRESRRLTEKELARRRPRRSYAGSELLLSLVDHQARPYPSTLRELDVRVLCSNRDLASDLAPAATRGADPMGEDGTTSDPERETDQSVPDFFLANPGPIAGLRTRVRPTLPRPIPPQGELGWRLVKHLGLNYLALAQSGGSAEQSLRELLRLYASPENAGAVKEIAGLRSLAASPAVAPVATPRAMCFARGLDVSIGLDESAFPGTGAFLFGSVLEQFLARYVSTNSFCRVTLTSDERGEIMRWKARLGSRPMS